MEDRKFTGIPIADVTEVVKDGDGELIKSWYERAGICNSPQALSDLSKHILGRFSHTEVSLPHAASAIVLGALKMIQSAEQGFMTQQQRELVMWNVIVEIMGFTKEEPLKLMRMADLMFPDTAKSALTIDKACWDWMQGCAKLTLSGLPKESTDPKQEEHVKYWTSIAEGIPPMGLPVES